MQDVCNFYIETNSQLCHDKFENGMSICSDNSKNATGICPKNFPIYESRPLLNRCIPKSISEKGKNLAHNLYELLNSWDFLKQALADLYKTWREILALSLLSFGIYFQLFKKSKKYLYQITNNFIFQFYHYL